MVHDTRNKVKIIQKMVVDQIKAKLSDQKYLFTRQDIPTMTEIMSTSYLRFC